MNELPVTYAALRLGCGRRFILLVLAQTQPALAYRF